MEIDFYLFEKINQFALKSIWLDTFSIFFAKYLGYILVFFLFLLVLKNFKKYFSLFVSSLSIALFSRFVIVEIIRFFFPRERPFVQNHVNLLIDHLNQPAFPSGHAAFFFALSTVVYLENKKLGLIFFILSSFLSFFRIFCGVHWPSDIIFGALIGIICGFLGKKFLEKFQIVERLVKIKQYGRA